MLTLISAARPDLRREEFRWKGESLLADKSLLLGVVLGEDLPHEEVRSARVFDLVGERLDAAGDLRDVLGLPLCGTASCRVR